MDKFVLFLKTAGSKVTTWIAAALVLISQVQPLLDLLQHVVGTLNPAKALMVGAVITWIGRLRGILSDTATKVGELQANKEAPPK